MRAEAERHPPRVAGVSHTARRGPSSSHSRFEFEVEDLESSVPREPFQRRGARQDDAAEQIIRCVLWLLDVMSKSPRSGSVAKVKKKASSSPKAESTSKAKQWEMVRTELEGKVASLQEELTGMRKWCLAALGEAEKRTAELRTQNAGLQRQVVDEAQRKADALHAAESNMQKLQEEKKLKLMVRNFD